MPDGCSFDDIVALKGDKEIGDRINKITAQLANANDLRGVIDVTSFNDSTKLGTGKAMVDRLSKLVAIFDDLDFRASRADGDDLLGDAYEYLMRHFATESGKSKGQFYTPAEVSRVLAKVVGINESARHDQTIYDPTCGSGSLLLKAADEAPRGLTAYGQEMDVATWALARMNMILHDYETAEIHRDNVITNPGFTRNGQLKRHDFVVANPPFSTKSWSSGISPENDEFSRFEYGIPPAKNGDYAFLLHAIKSLKSTGKAAVILPHGVLFRGGAEATIRRELLKRGLIKGVIGLPANLFYGTGIPACIVVVDKESAEDRDGVFMIDASRGFRKDGAKNRLRAQDIHKIVDVFTKQTEVERYSRAVPLEEISSEANDFNLNIPRYVDASEPDDIQNLDAHLNGGIPDYDLDQFSDYWQAFPSLREQLFEPERPGYNRAKVDTSEVQATIQANEDFQIFEQLVSDTLTAWWGEHHQRLKGIEKGTPPKPIIRVLSEDLLRRFGEVPLLSSYDVYEQLMTYWAETMQDDIYLISVEGWVEAAEPRPPREISMSDKGKANYEHPDLKIGNGKKVKKYMLDLIPVELVIDHYFAEEKAVLSQAQAQLDQAEQSLEAFVEEHSVGGGPLDGIDGKGGIPGKGSVIEQALKYQQQLLNTLQPGSPEYEAASSFRKSGKEAFGAGEWTKGLVDPDDLFAELDALYDYLRVFAELKTARDAAKSSETALKEASVAKYGELMDDEVKELAIDAKWIGAVRAAVGSVVANSMLLLGGRVTQLEARYAETLSVLEGRAGELEVRVAEHLAAMGEGMKTH